jgi:hypothetical protein
MAALMGRSIPASYQLLGIGYRKTALAGLHDNGQRTPGYGLQDDGTANREPWIVNR